MNSCTSRENAISVMKTHIDSADWESNAQSLEKIKLKIKNHSLVRHPMIDLLKNEHFGVESLKRIHLEYRYAIVQVFTDALLMAQYQAKQIEPRLTSGAKMAPRFILTLNILDEFGFVSSLDNDGHSISTPKAAHYPLFEDVLNKLGVTDLEKLKYQPSRESKRVKEYLEASFEDYNSILILLAVAETQVITFSPPLRQALRNAFFDVKTGYYQVHGTSTDGLSNGTDDHHENDLWTLLIHACTKDEIRKLSEIAMAYCDLWSEFWSSQLRQVNLLNQADSDCELTA